MPRQPGNGNYSQEILFGIVSMARLQGNRRNITAIANEYGISRHGVRNVLSRNEENNTPIPPRRNNQNNTSTTVEEDEEIANLVQAEPFLPATQYVPLLDLQCTPQTVRNRIRATGRRSHKPAKKPIINEHQKRGRLNWALGNQQTNWENIIFSDETHVTCNETGHVQVWRPRDTRFNEEFISYDGRSGRTSIAAWSFMSANGLGGLVRINGRMNAAQYVRILEQNMLPYLQQNPGRIFQQDLSPIHTARQTTEFLHVNNINMLPWTAKNADMNPIENIWAALKKKGPWLGARNNDLLWDRVRDAWTSIQIDHDFIDNLYGSMDRRIREVIRKEGGWTKY